MRPQERAEENQAHTERRLFRDESDARPWAEQPGKPIARRSRQSGKLIAYAALLWLEFVASADGQKVLEEGGPYEGSVFIQGTVQEKAVRGKKQSLVDWRHYSKMPEYMKRVVEAYGFPRAEK